MCSLGMVSRVKKGHAVSRLPRRATRPPRPTRQIDLVPHPVPRPRVGHASDDEQHKLGVLEARPRRHGVLNAPVLLRPGALLPAPRAQPAPVGGHVLRAQLELGGLGWPGWPGWRAGAAGTAPCGCSPGPYRGSSAPWGRQTLVKFLCCWRPLRRRCPLRHQPAPLSPPPRPVPAHAPPGATATPSAVGNRGTQLRSAATVCFPCLLLRLYSHHRSPEVSKVEAQGLPLGQPVARGWRRAVPGAPGPQGPHPLPDPFPPRLHLRSLVLPAPPPPRTRNECVRVTPREGLQPPNKRAGESPLPPVEGCGGIRTDTVV